MDGTSVSELLAPHGLTEAHAITTVKPFDTDACIIRINFEQRSDNKQGFVETDGEVHKDTDGTSVLVEKATERR